MNISAAGMRDTGSWECVATNSVGEARISSSLNVIGSEGLALEAISDQSWQRVQQLEAPKEKPAEAPEEAVSAPKITVQLNSPSGLEEGDSVHLEARYTPAGARCEWLKDGQPLQMANKHKVVSDFGFGILDILYLLQHDIGQYTLRVWNEQGEATTSTTIDVAPKEGLLLQPINENKATAIQNLEESLNRRPEVVDLAPEERIPVFVHPLSAPVQCKQGERVHFQASYEPINDPNLHISYYLNGRPLNASRVKTLNEFGTVILEFASVIPEDSGEIKIIAKNNVGEAVTSTNLTVDAVNNLLLDPVSEASWQRVQQIEAEKPPPEEAIEIVHGPPRFVTQLQQPPQLREGALLHLDAQLEPVGDPKLMVEWSHNGQPIRVSLAREKFLYKSSSSGS